MNAPRKYLLTSYEKFRNSYNKLHKSYERITKSYESYEQLRLSYKRVAKSYKKLRIVTNELSGNFKELRFPKYWKNGLPIRAPRQLKTKIPISR